MKFIFNKKILISLFSVTVLLLFTSRMVFAVWNGTFYEPGDTLNPECLPTDVDCDVRAPLTSLNISDAVYGAGWDTDTTHAPSKNALYDKIEGLVAGSHDPISLGVSANGLSLATQVLSLALASTSTTGALSNTDWNTFNDKVSSQWTTSASDVYYNTGSVGIGTTTPNNLIQVANLINFDDTNFVTKLGYGAGINVLSGAEEGTYVGYQAGKGHATLSTIAADYNTAVGYNSLSLNRSGNSNTALGDRSLYNNSSANSNTGVGMFSLYQTTSGGVNTAVGYAALYGNTTGQYNIAMGVTAGRYITDGTTANATGSNSLFLGSNTRALADGQTNQIVIGDGATGIGSNSVVLGNDSIATTALKGSVGIGTTTPDQLLTLNSTGGLGWDNGSGTSDTRFIRSSTSILDLRNATTGYSIMAAGGFYGRSAAEYGFMFKESGRIAELSSNFNIAWSSTTAAQATKDVSISRGAAGKLYVGNGTQGDFTGTLIAGNVGIGTVSPSSPLDVSSSGNTNIDVRSTSASAETSIKFWDRTFNNWKISNRNLLDTPNNRLTFQYNSSEKVTILSDGNVGIGTTSPSAKLEVNNNGTNQTVTTGFQLSNTTAATAVMNQYSPALQLTGQGWNGASTPISVRQYVSSRDGGPDARVYYDMQYQIGAGTWENMFHFDSSSLVMTLRGINTEGITMNTSSQRLSWTGGSMIRSNVGDGILTFTNNAATDFGRLQFGGITSAFPAIKRNTTDLEVKLADDSAYSRLVGYRLKTTYAGIESAPAIQIGADNVGFLSGYLGIYGSYSGSHVVAMTTTRLATRRDSVIGWNSANSDLQNNADDTGLSRGAAAKIYVGNGTAGDYSGTLIAGNVGIGTATPQEKLDVRGDIFTDRWLVQGSNTFMGVDVAGAGTLAHTSGDQGYFNTAYGSLALNNISTGIANTAIGYRALYGVSTGNNNISVGRDAGYGISTGSSNFALGTSSGNIGTGNDSIAIGTNAMSTATNPSNSIAIGTAALTRIASNSVVAIGRNAGWGLSVGTNSVLVGDLAGQGPGTYNAINLTAIGSNAGYNMITGANNNTLIGFKSGYNLSSGANNIIIGATPTSASSNLTTGSNNIIIGYDISAPAADSANTLNIGNLIFATGLTSTGTTISTGNVGIGTTSPTEKLTLTEGRLLASGVTPPTLASQTSGGVDESLNSNYEAVKFTMSGTAIGGIELQLKRTGTISGGTIGVYLYTDSGGAPGTNISDTSTGQPTLVYGAGLTTGYVTYYFREQVTGLTNGASYWIVIAQSGIAGGGSVEINSRTSGTALHATSADASSWATEDSKELYYVIEGDTGATISGFATNQYGLEGQSYSGFGVRGTSVYGAGAKFDSIHNFGVGGSSIYGVGLRGSSVNGIAIQGISTGSAGAQFQTTAAGQVGMQVISTTGVASQAVALDPTGILYQGLSSAFSPVFQISNDGSGYFAGNTGIGVAATSKLDILDTTLAGSGSLAGSVLNLAQTWNTTGAPTAIKLNVTNTASNAASLLIDLQVGGVSKFNVSNAGVIQQAGCTTAGTLSADVSGNIICTPSSERFKNTVNDLDDSLSNIMALRPVSYNFNSDMNMDDRTYFGFISEEVADVTSEFATYDKEGAPYGLDTNAILASTVKAIQEMNLNLEDVRGLEGEVNGESFFSRLLSKLTTWLADAGNGIKNIFVEEVNTKEICISDETGEKTCITKTQLDALILNANITAEPEPTPDPAPVDPTPVDPLGSSPTGDATPVDPTPTEPVDPVTPVDPTPTDPVVDPTPVDPTPVDPAPVDPVTTPPPSDEGTPPSQGGEDTTATSEDTASSPPSEGGVPEGGGGDADPAI